MESKIDNTIYSICYKSECEKDKKQIKVFVNDSIIICPSNGSIIYNADGYNGIIKCPDYNLVYIKRVWPI